MGFKCKCSLPHADLSWSPLVTSVSIYTRNNNKKFAALANMGNQHIIMCVTVVHLYIPCGGDEKAPLGCNLKAPRKNSYSKEPECQEVSAVPQELSSFPMHAGACSAHCGLVPGVCKQWRWYSPSYTAKRELSFWLRAGKGKGHTDVLWFMPVTGWPGWRHGISTLSGMFVAMVTPD